MHYFPSSGSKPRFQMNKTLDQLCAVLRGHGLDAQLVGDPGLAVSGVATLEDAVPGQITFLSNPKYERMLDRTEASAVVLKPDQPAKGRTNLIRTKDPYAAITALIVAIHGHRKHRSISPDPTRSMIDPTATIGDGASIYPGATVDHDAIIGANAVIYPGCYVGPRCRIGDKMLLYPNVVIYDDCVLGDRVTIHAGTVIGQDGLGYAPVGGKWVKIPQIGIVELGDDVEIGANCAIDRATLGRTRIGSGTKLSDLIAIGHGTQIGEDCMFVAQVGIAGSVTVGNSVTMAGQAGVVGHISIGDHATIAAKAGVTNNVPAGETVLGQPAVPITEAKRRMIHAARLPDLSKTVKRLESEIERLRAQFEQRG
jgi:UDP-3-O-[3-hydroxymyristoyl] glucosamine N-acyltransferase